MANENPKLTITLTGRRPVTVAKDVWPILAEAKELEHDNQYEFQANRKTSARLAIRQHADGRTIVYGVFQHTTQFQGESDIDVRGGEMISAEDDAIAAVNRVADDLDQRITHTGLLDPQPFSRVAHKCIADLPAEEL